MITADGRSTVEMEIEHMQFTGLDTRAPVFGLDYSDISTEPEDTLPHPALSFLERWIERLFNVGQPISR